MCYYLCSKLPTTILCKYQIGLKVESQLRNVVTDGTSVLTKALFYIFFHPSSLGLAEALDVVLVLNVSGTVATT